MPSLSLPPRVPVEGRDVLILACAVPLNAQRFRNEAVAASGDPGRFCTSTFSGAFRSITQSASNQCVKGANATIKNIFSPVPLGSDFVNFVWLYPLKVCADVLTVWGSTC